MARKSKIRSFFRGFLWFLLIAIVGFNVYLAISDRFYFYQAVAKTYFVGQAGPGIYDLDYFPYQTIDAAAKPSVFYRFGQNLTLTDSERAYLDSLQTTSFLVMRNDTILLEYYANDHDETMVSNSFSTAKSVVSLLLAIAVEDGFIKSFDEPVANYLSEFNNPEKKGITIRHLLTMSSGLEWSESGGNPFTDNAEAYYGTDLRKLVLGKKPIRKPGEMFEYTSMSTQVLCYVLEAATKKPMGDYFQERLWRRIGSENDAYWSKESEDGDYKAYCCMYLTTRDYGRLGLLILNNGKYQGEQIIPEWYMNEAFVPDTKLNTLQDEPNQRYSLHWWVVPGDGDTLRYARGINGQYVMVVPSKNLVIVRTGHKRTPDVTDKSKLKQNQVGPFHHQIGHPTDVLEYLQIAFRLAESAK
jgi:CubicO group peptidase (beta-lactamase class C family)